MTDSARPEVTPMHAIITTLLQKRGYLVFAHSTPYRVGEVFSNLKQWPGQPFRVMRETTFEDFAEQSRIVGKQAYRTEQQYFYEIATD